MANKAINSDHLRYVNVSSSIRKSIDYFSLVRTKDMHKFCGSGSNLMTWFRSTNDHRGKHSHTINSHFNERITIWIDSHKRQIFLLDSPLLRFFFPSFSYHMILPIRFTLKQNNAINIDSVVHSKNAEVHYSRKMFSVVELSECLDWKFHMHNL